MVNGAQKLRLIFRFHITRIRSIVEVVEALIRSSVRITHFLKGYLDHLAVVKIRAKILLAEMKKKIVEFTDFYYLKKVEKVGARLMGT